MSITASEWTALAEGQCRSGAALLGGCVEMSSVTMLGACSIEWRRRASAIVSAWVKVSVPGQPPLSHSW